MDRPRYHYRPRGRTGIERVRLPPRQLPLRGELVDPEYEPMPAWARLLIAAVGWTVFAVGEVFLVVMWLLGK